MQSLSLELRRSSALEAGASNCTVVTSKSLESVYPVRDFEFYSYSPTRSLEDSLRQRTAYPTLSLSLSRFSLNT